jgi:hypothetical protein
MIPDGVLFIAGFLLLITLVRAAWDWFGPGAEQRREQVRRRRAARR